MAEHTAHDINFRSAKFEAAYGTATQLPPSTRPEVTFAGRSNVGKSSLLNRLFERKQLAKVSSRPGKTATINFYDVDGLHLVDLPGYGYARVSHAERARWDELIGGYFDQERSFNLVCALVDIRHEAQKLDVQMVEFLKEGGFPFIVVLTKADKLGSNKMRSQRAAIARQLGIPASQIIATSSAKGTGIDELRARIADACLEDDEDDAAEAAEAAEAQAQE